MKIDLNRPLKPRDNPTVVIPLHELRALEALAADRKKLLRRIDTVINLVPHLIERIDKDLLDDITKELGDD